MKSWLELRFLPRNPDLALLLLRVWLGGSMLVLHGWPKFRQLVNGNHDFPDPLRIGSMASLGLATLAEFACSILLILGLFSRLAALMLAVTLGVAWVMIHQMKFSGSGELAFVYLGGFLALFLAGSGKYSVGGQG